MARPDRRRHELRGRLAETLAAAFLLLKGYGIVATRKRFSVGEIDLVVRRGDVLVFVEVKLRSELALAGESVSVFQRDRIVRSATLFLRTRPELSHLQARFDAVLIAPWRLPHHIPNAWNAD